VVSEPASSDHKLVRKSAFAKAIADGGGQIATELHTLGEI
jgi:hypothetical protein